MLTRNSGLESEVASGIPFGSVWWFAYAGICCFLVLFAGIMSGLTLGLMSLGLVDLEILQRSGTPSEKKQAGNFIPIYLRFLCFSKWDWIYRNCYQFFIFLVCVLAAILPVVQKQHQLLVTLLLCNAVAMEVSLFANWQFYSCIRMSFFFFWWEVCNLWCFFYCIFRLLYPFEYTRICLKENDHFLSLRCVIFSLQIDILRMCNFAS